jgi:hypothetical protein
MRRRVALEPRAKLLVKHDLFALTLTSRPLPRAGEEAISRQSNEENSAGSIAFGRSLSIGLQ